jgi:hypothetical protein
MPSWRSWAPSDPVIARPAARRRRTFHAALLLGAVMAVLVGRGAPAEDAAPDPARDTAYRRANESLVERHVVPRSVRLAETTAALDEAARRFCEGPSSPTSSVDVPNDRITPLPSTFVTGARWDNHPGIAQVEPS